MEGRKFYIRTGIVAGIAIAVVLAFIALLCRYQLVAGVDDETMVAINTVSTTQPLSAARGEITDRDGVVLVSNHTEYQITISFEDMEEYDAQAEIVLRLLELCAECDVDWKDTEMPISMNQPYTFTAGNQAYNTVDEETGEISQTRLSRLCDAMGWEKTHDADALIDEMRETYGLGEGVNDGTARAALGVLYSCALRKNEIIWTDYVFAEDVPMKMIAVIEEEDLPGVTVSAVSARQIDTKYAAHLLGQVGYITAENWTEGENYSERGYEMDDIVGLSGVEYAFESYLRGTDGVRTVTTNTEGDVVAEEVTEAALAGSNVALTIDSKLQRATERALNRYTAQINEGNGGSAAVVIDVSDGSVLASASWPTFDASTMTYDEEAEELSPLFNRALQGTYAPGSTYKMVTAVAGLETGVISPSTYILDTGYLDYYDTTFRCWLYRQSKQTHGEENVSDALRDSCNIFFYNVALDLGSDAIDILTNYAQAFGLGVSSGIELTESVGVNAGPAYSESVGATWYGGNLLSAAIGQSDNLFTPLQIANYVATLANGGTRYAAHLLQSVTDVDGTVTPYTPQVLSNVEISDENLAAIREGMLEVVDSTSGVSDAFANLNAHGILVGAKTGSAQVDTQENANGLFVCFAPYDDPQIAVCVAVENGGSGAATAVIAAAILESYFGVPSVPVHVQTKTESDETVAAPAASNTGTGTTASAGTGTASAGNTTTSAETSTAAESTSNAASAPAAAETVPEEETAAPSAETVSEPAAEEESAPAAVPDEPANSVPDEPAEDE